MTVATAKKLEREVKKLKREVAVLKAAVLVKDPEGEYHPEFVREIRRLAKTTPTRTYRKGVFSK